jgi:hypothetical protein
MKYIKCHLLLIAFATPFFCKSQTRDNAGLQGADGATSGFFQTEYPVNYPTVATGWWHFLDVRHTNPANNYAMQFAGSFFNQDLFFRKTVNDPSQLWSKVILEREGKVGIGIGTPINGLHLFGSENNFDNGSIRLGYSGSYDAVLSFGWNGVDQDAFKISQFAHNSLSGRTDFLTIKSTNGNLGVGISNPRSKIHVGAGTSDVISIGTTDYGGNAGQALAGIKAGQTPGGDGGILEFQTLSWGALPYDLTTKMIISGNTGNVGIGTSTPGEKLSVNGKIRAREVKVETTNWPDYVFAKNYKLPSLAETEEHIKKEGHLPGIPSAQEVKANGIDLGEMNAKLLQKIEELTLHLIQKEKDIDAQNLRIRKLEESFLKLTP